MAPRPGQAVPDFVLPGLVGSGHTTIRHDSYRPADHRGRPLVLAFYPGDDTPTCTWRLRS